MIDFFANQPYATLGALVGFVGMAIGASSVAKPSEGALKLAAEHIHRKQRTPKAVQYMTIFDKEDLHRPRIAWPTCFLLTGSILLWLYSWYRYIHTKDALTSYLLSTVATYMSFTPLHEAVHRSVFSRLSALNWLNDYAGHVAMIPFGAPAKIFAIAHLEHHKHTNEGDLDPDHWAGEGPVLLLPLRWATVVFAYVGWFRRHVIRDPHISEAQAVQLIKEGLLDVTIRQGAFLAMWWHYNEAVLVCYLFPALTAFTLLMYAFDYLPHRPHHIAGNTNPFKATHLLTIPFLPTWFTDAIFLQQNLHSIHHLVCFLPFYQYRKMVEKYGSLLKDKGVRDLPLLLMPSREAYLEELN